MSQPYVGEIREFAGNFAPAGWMLCQGQLLAISEYDTLFNLIGTTYGGDGQSTFALPDLQGRVPIHQGTGGGGTYQIGEKSGVESVTLTVQQIPIHGHVPMAGAGGVDSPANNAWGPSTTGAPYAAAPSNTPMKTGNIGPTGNTQPHDNMIPYLSMNYIISLFGIFPSQSGGGGATNPFLGQLNIYSFNFAPSGAAMCNGQLLPINQNQALFSLLGTMYGGNGQTNFALPNLQGRVPMHIGSSNTGSSITQGQTGGEINHTLILQELPTHTHQVSAASGAPDVNTPTGNTWASNTGFSPYSTVGGGMTGMDPSCISNTGGSQAHNNMSPYLVLNICIALVGIFPSRN